MRKVAVVLLLCALGAGCGSQDNSVVIVGAAASLRTPMSALADSYERETGVAVRVQLAGSGALAAQVRQGAPIDVFVSADPLLAGSLNEEGLGEPPVQVAGNELVVLALETSEVRQPADIGARGARLAIGAESVPVGAYARTALRRWGPEIERRALANVRTEEIDARGLTAKLEQGVVDAAIAYRTDAAPLTRPVRVLELPPVARPDIRYVASAISTTNHSRAFIEWLAMPPAQAEFARAGFRTR